MRVLIVYGTAEGQTRKIASFAADRLTSRGHTVLLADANGVPAALDATHSAFLSVSLSAASQAPDDVQGLQRCLDAFVRQTRWAPRSVHHVAGALRYSEYGFLTRWIMRIIALRRRAPTDTRRDHEFTDWKDLADFIDRFAAAGARRRPQSTESRERSGAGAATGPQAS